VAETHDQFTADEPDEEGYDPRDVRRVLHWYDFLCPFCYVGRQRNTIFEDHGFDVIDIPFQAHSDIPRGGRAAGCRAGPMYGYIEQEARAAGLPLVWPDRLPNTRMALAAAEWVRRHAPLSFPALEKALFAAHFARGEDIGDPDVVAAYVGEAGADAAATRAALDDGSAYALVDRSERLGERFGVRGTPAWLVAGRLIPGLYPHEHFDVLAQSLAGWERAAGTWGDRADAAP